MLTPASRCPTHQRAADAAALRVKRERRPHSHAERVRRAGVVAAWVRVHGWVCPGWDVPEHPSGDLTAAHVVAVAAGGDEGGALGVLCRTCNSRQGITAGQSPAAPAYVVRSDW